MINFVKTMTLKMEIFVWKKKNTNKHFKIMYIRENKNLYIIDKSLSGTFVLLFKIFSLLAVLLQVT